MNQQLHPNVIIHMDVDYFYAQVEEVLNPELKEKPFGVQQGMNIVTCNYIARSFGVKKWRPLKESLEKCPDLILVKGEDLSNYKIYSKRIAELLHSMIGVTERMGLDEHYIDLTKLVDDRLSLLNDEERESLLTTGPLYPNEETFNKCDCGCDKRLMIGSKIAQEIREKIFKDLKLTCSVGIAHNKLLAKLVGQMNKPDNQTTLAPLAAAEFMSELKDLRSIHGIGGKTASRIEELGIKTILDLQQCKVETLLKSFNVEMATRLKEMALGIDGGEVKPSGKPKTVGLEDSCRPFSTRVEAQEMFQSLLPRLVYQVRNDMRLPLSLRVTVRQFDIAKKVSYKETKQVSLVPSYFKFVDGELQLTNGAEDKILKETMAAFDLIIGSKQKFLVNLVGLCFTKFQEQKTGAGAITNFLTRKLDESSEQLNSSAEDKMFKEPSLKRRKLEDPLQLPPNVDANVWKELPIDMQRELLRSWSGSAGPTSTVAPSKPKNTLMNNFLRKQS